jgi:hypothetical protein
MDSTSGVHLPYGTGAFVPYDVLDPQTDGKPAVNLIVGRSDLRPVFGRLEAAGRKLWVISDSCYSGQMVRTLALDFDQVLPSRVMPLLLEKTEVQKRRNDTNLALSAPPPEAYPYRATGFLAAAAEGEQAKDIPRFALSKWPTLDGKPHGAMTDALLRVLSGEEPADFDADGWLSLNEVHRAVSDFMAMRAYGHTPQRLPAVVDDVNAIGARPVLAVRGVAKVPADTPLQPLRVAWMPPSPTLAPLVAGLPDVRIVAADQGFDLLLRKDSARAGLQFVAPSGDPLALVPDDTKLLVGQIRQLAWAKRLRQLAERHRRAVLPFDVDPAALGGNLWVGSQLRFVTRPDRKATLIVLDIDSSGHVNVLCPFTVGEDRALPAGQAAFIPGESAHQRIEVQAPLGMDLVFAFAFDERPAELHGLFGARELDPADPRLSRIEQWLSAQHGRFTFAAAEFRTLAR